MPVNEDAKKQGLEFTETMRGFFVRDPQADFQQLDVEKPDGAESFEFTLTVLSNDLDALLGNPDHRASLNGIVSSPSLSAETMNVADGVFNLFVENADEVETRNMIYRCCMNDGSGKPFFMHGYKTIRPGSPLLIWHDTTTLYITLYDGADETSPVLGRGILRIEPMDFAKQLTTMRAPDSKDKVEELKGLARFGVFFADTLYRTYGGVFDIE